MTSGLSNVNNGPLKPTTPVDQARKSTKSQKSSGVTVPVPPGAVEPTQKLKSERVENISQKTAQPPPQRARRVWGPRALAAAADSAQPDLSNVGTGIDSETDNLSKTVRVTDLVSQLNAFKSYSDQLRDLEGELRNLKNELLTQNSTQQPTPEEQEHLLSLQTKIDDKEVEILKIRESMAELKLAIAESTAESLKGALAIFEKGQNAFSKGSDVASNLNETFGVVTQTVLAPFLDIVALKKSLAGYKANKNAILETQKEIAVTSDVAETARLQQKLTNLMEEKKRLLGDVGESSVKTVGTGASVGVVGMDTLTAVGSEAMSVIGGVVSVGTGAIAVGVHGRKLYSNAQRKKKIFNEQRQVMGLKANTPPNLKSILEMRLKCLQKQDSETTISNIKSALGLSAGAVGVGTSTAVFVGLVATGALVAAAGIGVIVAGSVAATIGIGYAVYAHRNSLKIKGSRFVNWIKKIHIVSKKSMVSKVAQSKKSKIQAMEMKKTVMEQRVALTEVNREEITKYNHRLESVQNAFQKAIDRRIEVEERIAQLKSQGSVTGVKELKNSLRPINQEIEAKKQELYRLKANIDFLSKQILKVEKRRQKSEALGIDLGRRNQSLEATQTQLNQLTESLEKNKFKSQILYQKAIIGRLKDRLGIQEDEVVAFRSQLENALKEPQNQADARSLFEKLDVTIIEDDLLQTAINYILKKV